MLAKKKYNLRLSTTISRVIDKISTKQQQTPSATISQAIMKAYPEQFKKEHKNVIT